MTDRWSAPDDAGDLGDLADAEDAVDHRHHRGRGGPADVGSGRSPKPPTPVAEPSRRDETVAEATSTELPKPGCGPRRPPRSDDAQPAGRDTVADRFTAFLRPVLRPWLLGVVFGLITLPAWLEAVSWTESSVLRWSSSVLIIGYCLGAALLVPLSHLLSTRLLAAACAGLYLLGLVPLGMFGLDMLWTPIYALAVIAALLSMRTTVVVTGVTVLGLAIACAVAGDLGEQVDSLVIIVSVPLAVGVAARLTDANAELRQAQERIAVLAVYRERERLARDLHDILGHSLTTITVRAALARRVLESAGDVERAAAEIGQVEELSRQAMSDVRATVAEYREVWPAGELAGARAALRAAEIEADLPQAVDDITPRLRTVFGYVLRESVTNVLRHSDARRVTVRLGPTWIEIVDDGTRHSAADSSARADGNGLRNLRERLRQVEGTLTAGFLPDGGFRVRAEAPADGAAPRTPGDRA